MVMDYFEDKKPILIFVFFLNAMIMIVMGIVIWGENLFIADRVVDFCKFVFIVNTAVCGIYFLIVLLFIFKIVIIGGGKIYNKITPSSKNIIIPENRKTESDENKKKRMITVLDFIKDPVIIFSGLFLVFAVLTFTFYFTMSPLYLTILSFALAIFMGILFLMRTRGEMIMVFKIFLVFFGIFLAIFIFTIIWNNTT